MSEIIIFSLGMVVMLLIAILVIGVIVMIKLSKRTQTNKDNLACVCDIEIPALQTNIVNGNNDLERYVQDIERNLEKKIDSRVDKLKLEFDNKFNNI